MGPTIRGEVLVEGQPVIGVGRERGMVFQTYTSFGWLTVRENVEYGLRLRSIPHEERQKLSASALITRAIRRSERAVESVKRKYAMSEGGFAISKHIKEIFERA